MHQPRRLRLAASIVLCFVLQTLGADKYTDENRPYEFGFKIDGQHRHESKDKDGIIMGEFGFITADDVYHVTVYATDKEGRFKILSMKNIHLKSSSPSSLGAPTSARQGHALALPPAQTASVQASAQIGPFAPQAPVSQGAVASQSGKPFKPVSIEPPGGSCSSCSLPTTTTQAPLAYNQVPDNNNYNGPNQFGAPGSSPQNEQGFPPSSPGQQIIAQDGPIGSSYNPQGGQWNYPSGQQNIPQQGLVVPDGVPNYPGPPIYSQEPGSPNAPIIQDGLFGGNNNPYAGATTVPNSGYFEQNNIQQAGLLGPNFYPQGERTAKQYTGPEQQFDSNLGPNGPQGPGAAQGGQRGSAKPTLFSAQIQIVDKNTDIYGLGPNEQNGLPPGLIQSDMTQLLYTFNYTVGFHGHFEEGYTNGVKKGYYFVTGRNGVRTRIDYEADDTGFHPKVSQEVLDLLSEDVPKPETEKDEKYGLKGYEFNWLYYPVESKKR